MQNTNAVTSMPTKATGGFKTLAIQKWWPNKKLITWCSLLAKKGNVPTTQCLIFFVQFRKIYVSCINSVRPGSTQLMWKVQMIYSSIMLEDNHTDYCSFKVKSNITSSIWIMHLFPSFNLNLCYVMKQHEKCGYVYDFITKSSKKPKQNCKKNAKGPTTRSKKHKKILHLINSNISFSLLMPPTSLKILAMKQKLLWVA